MPESQEKRWQDHGVIIAIISGAATLVFAYNVLFPMLTASLQNEVSSLRSQVQEIAELKSRIAALDTAAKVERQKLVEAQLKNVFSLGNPYPVGFGKVRLGDSIETIQQNFPETSIDRVTSNFWGVKFDHPVFQRVTYYFDRPRELKDRRVRQLLFHGANANSTALKEKLIEALGPPVAPGPKPECFVWAVDKIFVKMDSPNSFTIGPNAPDCQIEQK